MKLAGMAPVETICIGDEQRDIEAPHAHRGGVSRCERPFHSISGTEHPGDR
jgi:hypothetical protein